MTKVAAGILERDGRVLICRRRADQPHPLKWEFPGGKIEAGESPQEALVRELREELGIESEPAHEIARYEFAYPGKPPILLIFLKVSAWTGDIEDSAFDTILWESPALLGGYDFLEGDAPFILRMASGYIEQIEGAVRISNSMPQNSNSTLAHILALLAGKRYAVTQTGGDGLRIQETDSGVALQAVLQGDILFLSLVCATVAPNRITPAVMRKMLDAHNGISTSHFQLHEQEDGDVAVTLNNFCKLQDMGDDDEDDILSCVAFLLADVVHAKELIGSDLQ